MTIDILMPALSPTMEVGTLAKWMVKKGDIIKAGDLLAEIETDKAIMEFEAVDEGTILELSVKEGQTDIKVNSIIAKITSETSETLKNNKKSQEPLAEVKSDVDNLKIREKLIPNIEQINNVENKKNTLLFNVKHEKIEENYSKTFLREKKVLEEERKEEKRRSATASLPYDEKRYHHGLR